MDKHPAYQVTTEFSYQGHPLRLILGEPCGPLWINSDLYKAANMVPTTKQLQALPASTRHKVFERAVDPEARYALGSLNTLTTDGVLLLMADSPKPTVQDFLAWFRATPVPVLEARGNLGGERVLDENKDQEVVMEVSTVANKPNIESAVGRKETLARGGGPKGSGLSIFTYQSSSVRVIRGEDGEPWFVAADVCKALSIANSGNVFARLDDDEKSTIRITDSLIKQGLSDNNPGTSLNLVNQAGIFSLTFNSRKPEAKRFKRWVTHDVLPSIYKTGTYTVPAAVAPPKKRRGRLPLAERPSALDAGLPIPFNRFQSAFLDALSIQKRIRADVQIAIRIARIVAGRALGVDPDLYLGPDDLDAPLPAIAPPSPPLRSIEAASAVLDIPDDPEVPVEREESVLAIEDAPVAGDTKSHQSDDSFLSASALGKRWGVPGDNSQARGKYVNDMFIAAGLALRERIPGRSRVIPTAKGEPFALLSTTEGSPSISFYRWSSTIELIPEIAQEIRKIKNQKERTIDMFMTEDMVPRQDLFYEAPGVC